MRNQRGLTILEIIIIMAIIGTAIPAVLAAFARIVATGADVTTAAVATDLAQEKMEEIIKGKKFVDITAQGPTDLTGDFSQYNYQIIVEYVNDSDLDTPLGGGEPPTDFKRVRVVVTNDSLPDFSATLSTVIANVGY